MAGQAHPPDREYARRELARRLDAPHVTYLGAVGTRKKVPLLRDSRALLAPIAWDEPFGLVAAEAQAAGTPVIAFARGGLVEVVEDAVTGFLVEPGNVARAAAAVGSLKKLDRRRCRQHAVDDLNFDTCLAGYEALYASVSARAARASAGRLASND